MRIRRALPKMFAVFMAFSLAFTSCSPNTNSNTYIPGKSELPQADPENDYTLLELDTEILPSNTVLLQEQTQTVETPDGTLTTTTLSAQGNTDANGIIVFDDPMLPALLPVVIMDQNNQPVEGGLVHLVDKGDSLMITFTDPQGRYQPDWIIAEKADLVQATAGMADPDSFPFANLGGVMSARAALPILAIILIVVIIIEIVDAILTVIEIAKDPIQVTKLSDYESYECETPERIGKQAELGFSLITMFIPDPHTKIFKLYYKVATMLTGEAISTGVTLLVGAPVLYHRYYMSPDTTRTILVGEGYNPDQYESLPIMMYEEVGDCAVVPELVNMFENEALDLIESKGLKYEISYVNENLEPFFYNQANPDDLLLVVEQEPKPTMIHGIFNTEVETMLPLGDYPGLDNVVKLTVQVNPQISIEQPEEPDAGGDDTNTSQINYLILDRNYFCNEGPGKYYPVVTAFPAGTRLPLIGSDGQGWWQVAVEYQRLPACWIGGGNVDGDVADVPITARPDPPPNTNLGTGDVQITLFWFTSTDLDLAVVDPEGDEINYTSRSSPSGGILDQDANPGCMHLSNRPAENIYWPVGEAPEGEFSVLVRYYMDCGGNGPTQFLVRVLVDGVVTEYDGTIVNENDELLVVTFER